MDEDDARERDIVENLVRAAARISNLSHRPSMANSGVGGVQEYIENAFPTARRRHTQTSGGGQTSGLPGPSTGKNKCSLIKASRI